jgi:hypothetical protein
MRLWLAAHHITPIDFHLSGGYTSIGFDIAWTPIFLSESFRPPSSLCVVVTQHRNECRFGAFALRDAKCFPT